MPIVLIEVKKRYSTKKEIALMEAVYSALQGSFQILNKDICIRLLVHEGHQFFVPIAHDYPELYTLISIDCIAGRSIDAKRDLYRQIVENLADLDIPKDHIKILLRETTKENWGIRGGQAACDVDLGYIVEI